MNARDFCASNIAWGLKDDAINDDFYEEANKLCEKYTLEVLADTDLCLESIEIMAMHVFPDGIPDEVGKWLDSL